MKKFHSSAVNLAKSFGEKKIKQSKKEITVLEGLKWLDGEGSRFNILTARNWLHPKRPFPKNPWFVPPVPISDELRTTIYEEYRSNPKLTPRIIATKYKLSIIRVEAILRLKHLENNQVKEGYVLQKSWNNKMENVLGVHKFAKQRLQENLAIQDLSNITEADNQNLGFDRRPDGNYMVELSNINERHQKKPTVFEKNPNEANRRWKFIIADINEKKVGNNNVLVRDQDGTLREATLQERDLHYQHYPEGDLDDLRDQTFQKKLWSV